MQPNIYEILQSKPHNPHYLKRYYRFITSCLAKNKTLLEEDTFIRTEKHHICPKAFDLFPEYANLAEHKWNMAILTIRQHIISHIILWKAYGGSQIIPISLFLGNSYKKIKKVPPATILRLFEKAKIDIIEHNIGKMPYIDSSGKKYWLDKNDDLITTLKLKCIHGTKGKKCYNNGAKECYFFENEVPSGWVLGTVPSRIKLLTYSTRGKKIYNNGIKEAYLFEDKIPEGWTKGRLQSTVDKIKKKRDKNKEVV